MIIDEWSNRHKFETLLTYFPDGIAFAESLMDAPAGRYEAKHGIFALVQEGMTTDLDHSLMECHRDYVDVQLVVSGSERIETAGETSLQIHTPYNKDKDVALFSGSGQGITVTGGQFYMLFPQDVHKCCGMVDGEPGRYKKIVLKIPNVAELLVAGNEQEI